MLDEPVSHNGAIRKRVILRKGSMPYVTQVSRANFPAGEKAPAHSHPDMWELFLCDFGAGIMRVNADSISLSQGVWVLVEPGDVHEVASLSDMPLVLTVFGVAVSCGTENRA